MPAITPRPEIKLPEDVPGQIDAILKGLGEVDASMSAFEAIYIVQALQLALSHPSMCDDTLIPTQRVEQFARRLSDGVGRHPALTEILEEGWKNVEYLRKRNAQVEKEHFDEIARAEAIELPDNIRDLRGIAKKAGLKGASRLTKSKALLKLKELPPQELVAAHEAHMADAQLR